MAKLVRAKLTTEGRLVEALPDGATRPLQGETDWARVDAQTDVDIAANIAAEEAAELAELARRARRRAGLSQARFAERTRIPVDTIRSWEQGRRTPDRTAQAFLRLLDRLPAEIVRATYGAG